MIHESDDTRNDANDDAYDDDINWPKQQWQPLLQAK